MHIKLAFQLTRYLIYSVTNEYKVFVIRYIK